MTHLNIAHLRLHNQHIASAPFDDPGAVVRWMGATQAQDYFGALWAIGLRMQSANEMDVERAMGQGVIIRTHPMRGTWHFVMADDIHWLLKLMAARTIAKSASWYRQLELDDATIARSHEVFIKTLQGGKQLDRRELAAALEDAGISTQGLRLTFLLSRAELDGVIASGARRGKQLTFALLDEMVPVARRLERDEALAELARRYFTSHGPATLQDFAWWSGMTLGDARAGLEMNQQYLVRETIEGQDSWLAPTSFSAHPTAATPVAYLLPAYDEYTVAYKDRSAVLDPAYASQTGNGIFSPVIVIDGRIVGTWKRTLKTNAVCVETQLFVQLNADEKQALDAAIERYSTFLKLPAISAVG